LIAAIWIFVLLFVLAMFQPSDAHANAVSPATRAACTSSYLNFCSHTTPGTPQCRTCFKKNFKRLDHACKTAIKTDPAYRHNFSKKRR
jgi:hypothetical protein